MLYCLLKLVNSADSTLLRYDKLGVKNYEQKLPSAFCCLASRQSPIQPRHAGEIYLISKKEGKGH
jgi:hypothetical protein